MKAMIPLQRLYSIPDSDKENRPIVMQPKHTRVQSSLALRERHSNSFHNDPRIGHQKPMFRVQKSLNGDVDSHDQLHPSHRLKEGFQRVKTDCNVSVPMRNGRNLSIQSTSGVISIPIKSQTPVVYLSSFKKKQENPQVVSYYQKDILAHMRERSTIMQYKMNAFQVQGEINEKMRGILYDWLVDVHHKFKLDNETLFITTSILDRVLEVHQINKSKFQLFGVAALFIAAKYEEVYCVPHVRDLVYVCDNAYTKEEILQTEGLIIQLLNFEILTISPWRMLSMYQEFVKLEIKNYMLARYLIELAVLQYPILQYTSNVIASAAIYLVHKIRKIHPSWSQEIMAPLTFLQESDIRECAKELCNLLQMQDQKQLTSIKKKYTQPKYMEVARIRIEKRN